ncbi:unnamed protein product, partial [Staurois parvus]
KACTHLCNQSPGHSQNLVPGLEISSLPDLFEISRLQIPKQTLQTKEESEKPLSSVSNTYPGAPQPALLRIQGDRSPHCHNTHTHTHTRVPQFTNLM